MTTQENRFWQVDKGGWIAPLGGFVTAFIPFFFPRLHWIMSYLKILVHELGHSAVAWLFGYPGLPTFSLQHGGGVAIHGPQATWLLVLWAAAFALFIKRIHQNRRLVAISAIALSVYLACICTPVHELIELYMGQGTEILFGALFIFRAASNWAVHHALERILYGFAGFYLIFENLVFSWSLLFDTGYRAVYFDGIAPGLLNDFYRIWVEHMSTASFSALASFHMAMTILMAVAGIALHVRRSRHIEAQADLDESDASEVNS